MSNQIWVCFSAIPLGEQLRYWDKAVKIKGMGRDLHGVEGLNITELHFFPSTHQTPWAVPMGGTLWQENTKFQTTNGKISPGIGASLSLMATRPGYGQVN